MQNQKILSIETCFNKCSVCLFIDGTFHEKIDETRNNHTNSLPNFTMELLAENGIKVQNLDGVIVNHGPGSFTGIRIGIAFALGLVTPFNIPLFGISTLEACVLNNEKQAIAVNAIKDTFYIQPFENGVGGEVYHKELAEIEQEKEQFENLKIQRQTPNARQLIERFFFRKPEIYTQPLYVRPVNAIVGTIKRIKQ
jgi:tRNA threonylcarbamoyl adenosine modification protein YeaZ